MFGFVFKTFDNRNDAEQFIADALDNRVGIYVEEWKDGTFAVVRD